MRTLEHILNAIQTNELPPAWLALDRAAFSRGKQLWDYQQAALLNALKALHKYYSAPAPFSPNEDESITARRKHAFWELYRAHDLGNDADISVKNAKLQVVRLLKEYYPVQDDKISYEHFVNRIGFWMATGSGKTLVLVKLIELLWRLSRLGQIPAHDILVLTFREDLLDQLRRHVAEYNQASPELHLNLRDLREYPDVKRGMPSLFGERDLTVFYYRSDNISDVQKEKTIDFRNYEQNGNWYVLLDEAHKGDKEDSKRQHIYSILTRNGFLFNFSATFTDPRDILTTAYDFNLARFTIEGYGKHIAVLQQENTAFKAKDDYTGAEKEKIVLKGLLLLTLIRKQYDELRASKTAANHAHPLTYHRPLLLALVNSVNTTDADLKRFFRVLAKLAAAAPDSALWAQAKHELRQELADRPEYLFEGSPVALGYALLDPLTPADLLSAVFNSNEHGDIEINTRPSNRQELALKLKPADSPFALIKIGDVTDWLKQELTEFQINQEFEDETYFEKLNADDSTINLLMGSRSFYEGWDSPRPNVITFINIGTGTEARKFILQAVGRGVRIEPMRDQRRRLAVLSASNPDIRAHYQDVKPYADALESLFIFGTNYQALQTVLETMKQAQSEGKPYELELAQNTDAIDAHLLLVPKYRDAANRVIDESIPAKFGIQTQELDQAQQYVSYLADDRLLWAHHNLTPRAINNLHRALAEPERYLNPKPGARRYGNLGLLLRQLTAHLEIIPKEWESFEPLGDEINHYKHIQVLLENLSELEILKGKIKLVQDARKEMAEVRAQYGHISPEEYDRRRDSVSEREQFEYDGKVIEIWNLANHYYLPVILDPEDKADYIRHIIRVPSEVRFVRDLDRYLQDSGNDFEQFDWWLFSKIDETLDDIYLPYYDSVANTIRSYYPDFIFWMQKGNDYTILFVDPKGAEHTGYERKVEGYRHLFANEGDNPKLFTRDDFNVRVRLLLYGKDSNVPVNDRAFWVDSISQLVRRVSEV